MSQVAVASDRLQLHDVCYYRMKVSKSAQLKLLAVEKHCSDEQGESAESKALSYQLQGQATPESNNRGNSDDALRVAILRRRRPKYQLAGHCKC